MPVSHYFFVCLHKNSDLLTCFCLILSFLPPQTAYLPLIGGVLSALLILLVVGVAGACEHIIKQKTKPTEQRGTKLSISPLHFD